MSDIPKLGATGQFPDGKLNEDDEGQLQLAVAAKDGNVIIAFGKSVSWMAMPPEDAKRLAEAIAKRADEAAKGGS